MSIEKELHSQLIGCWRRRESAADAYPGKLEFKANSLYFGTIPGRKQAFTLWDVGKFEIVDARHIRMSTANDKNISYQFSLNENELRITDSDGKVIEFIREA